MADVNTNTYSYSPMRYYYDKNGNMTAKQASIQGSMYAKLSSAMSLSGRSTGTSLSIYRYDAFNRLANYNSGDVEASYTYNANNLRASKTVNRERMDFVWNGQNLAAENKDDTVNTYTYDMTGVHIANQNGTVTSYLKDYHGNIVGKTTKAGALFNELGIKMDYDAFGNQWIGDDPDPFGYCGEYLDSESGLIYLRNRYYDSNMGRFINEDPVKDGLNWYVYCNNNPVIFVDPWGLYSDIPGWLDWDGDGFVDSKDDKLRFDANSNNIADWIEAGYSNAVDWNNAREQNILIDFPHVQQSGYYMCWAASLSMVVKHLTGREMSDIRIAKDQYGEEGYNNGLATSTVSKLITNRKYLDGSRYKIDGGLSSDKLTEELIKENIDVGIPVIIAYQQHMRVIIGYDYSNGKNELIVDDPSYADDYIEYVNISDLKKAAERENEPIRISGIVFKRIR